MHLERDRQIQTDSKQSRHNCHQFTKHKMTKYKSWHSQNCIIAHWLITYGFWSVQPKKKRLKTFRRNCRRLAKSYSSAVWARHPSPSPRHVAKEIFFHEPDLKTQTSYKTSKYCKFLLLFLLFLRWVSYILLYLTWA